MGTATTRPTAPVSLDACARARAVAQNPYPADSQMALGRVVVETRPTGRYGDPGSLSI